MKSPTERWSAAAAVVVCAIAAAAAPAFAVPIVGGSAGSFSNLSSCDSSGSVQHCRITSSANGANTQVQWGSTSSANFVNPSTLTAVDVDIAVDTNADDVVIARLDWFNNATIAQWDLITFLVDWRLTVAFTQPSGSADTEVFDLTVRNPLNPPGDHVTGLSLGDLSNLSFALAGVTVADFRYAIQDGAGGSGSNDTTLTINSGQVDWYNSEGNNASLYITADFTYTGGPPPASVPQPAPLLLLAAGLTGLGAWTRRRRRT